MVKVSSLFILSDFESNSAVQLWILCQHCVFTDSSQASLCGSVSGQTLLLGDALSLELFQDVVQVAGVRVTVARQVGAELRLVVNLVPDDRVGLARGAGRAHGENEPAVPRYQEQPQNLDEEILLRVGFKSHNPGKWFSCCT